MGQLLYILPLLACPVGMGLMMWFMMRAKRPADPGRPPHTTATPEQEQELRRLRKEIDALRGEVATKPSPHKGPRA
ncbi:hypothetical protein J7E96_31260 [Streptomyces sp. ISL-96]|uniref:hypothetical protein n=1 Tax=Streptomyces sp. ISL-96 TaxID=2819191 RepID=UPI001BE7F48F|nr:hypothetical protein [Streptomyces sp. ISL-96]MBT2492911.1 hypothetical protein [Streptomyces sp. ISL-96]